ncbi:bacteriohemerythrin [Maridesulfovibrio sp.]|uniref:bacteriohemerythrin n=1 Tax=Maridesulfovibrio sp. TaxID=2795000 RepID=UPI0029F4812C|nr:bacteriohemerythrin [Maridesulfovibrio sp.]
MGRVEWNDGLNLGIKKIDEQHKELVGIINGVLEAFESGETDTAIDKLLKQLKEYTVHHFNAEEKYMEEIEYPWLSEHKRMHASLKQSVKSLQAARFHMEKVSVKDVKVLLSSWLIEHILRVDYKILKFMKEGKGKDRSENRKA